MAIAVGERIDTPGFGPWSVKDGIVHVQPPCEILANMVAVRIHLDDCQVDNGALKVVPGSHLHGELSTEAINQWTESHKPVTCELLKGGVLAMRPLVLHSSTRAASPRHRRVLHIEYASDELPNGLRWFEE
jgi:ectoine hydroxylase-related dioxygenase (phytanoyl-CoA dioxygenase family)